MKKARQKLILELVHSKGIGSQEALLEALRQRGYPVTQATVSRDIRDLGLVKKADSKGVYRYVLPETPQNNADLFTVSILAVDYAGNTVVLRCHSGTAQAVCTVLDGMVRPEVVGTLAGDDTIFVLLRTTEKARRFAEEMQRLIRR